MKQVSTWTLVLFLAIAIQLSLAADDDIQCRTQNGLVGRCRMPRDCRSIAKIMDEKEKNGILTTKQIAILQNAGGSVCSSVNEKFLCCEYQEDAEGIKQLHDLDCGRFGMDKILGGKDVKLMSRPWMALLNMTNLIMNINGFFCGGTLIHKRFVLTAAHCFTNQTLISVRLGEHQKSTTHDCRFIRGAPKCAPPVEDIGVEEVFVYEGFSEFHNDIALVKLARDVEFKRHIWPICLPISETLQEEVRNIDSFIVTGWGKTEYASSSDVLLEAHVSQREPSICQDALYAHIKSTQLCVGHLGNDSCNGDSGGPLSYVSYYKQIQRFVQHGIVSFGAPVCADRTPAVYTRVASFIPWISHIIATK